MQCPIDKSEMISTELDGFSIDECPQCKGVWLDSSEFEQIKDKFEPDANWIDFNIWKHEDQFVYTTSPRQCPNDKVAMVSLKYGDTEVEIDCCTHCHGLWFDNGELTKILQTLENEINQTTSSEYLAESLGEARDIVTGKEGFASDWRDLSTVLRLFQYRLLSEKPNLYKALYIAQRAGLGLAGYNVD
jgi:uncharacterized protein